MYAYVMLPHLPKRCIQEGIHVVATFSSKHMPAGMSKCTSPARHPGVNHASALALQLWVQICGEACGEQ